MICGQFAPQLARFTDSHEKSKAPGSLFPSHQEPSVRLTIAEAYLRLE